MSTLLILSPVALIVTVLAVFLIGRRARGLSNFTPDAGVRHLSRWKWAGVVAGAVCSVAIVGFVDSGLGRGLLLAAPAFSFCVLIGVAVGEWTFPIESNAERKAAIEVRRIRDYLPIRLSLVVALMLCALVVLLCVTTVTASSDDLGRNGRSLTFHCSPDQYSSSSPYPGSYYSIPIGFTFLVGLGLTVVVIRRTVGRRRVSTSGELREADDRNRRRAAQSAVGALGFLAGVPLIGLAFTTALAIRGATGTCDTASALHASGWVLVAVAIGALAALVPCVSAIASPTSSTSPRRVDA